MCNIAVSFADGALLLTLLFLRADTAAHGGEQVGLLDDADAGGEVAVLDGLDEIGDVDTDRAALDTWLIRAVQATLRCLESHVARESQGDLPHVMDAFGRILFRHGDGRQFQSLSGIHRGSPSFRPILHA